VSVELGGVIGHLDPDVARVHLGLALEGFLDLGLDLRRADRRLDDDGVSPGLVGICVRRPTLAGLAEFVMWPRRAGSSVGEVPQAR
jgi:hypothetical protein